MDSFSYLINMHAGLVFFVTAGILTLVLTGIVALSCWLDKKTNFPRSISKALLFAILGVCAVAVFGGISIFRSTGDMGGIRKIFIVPNGGDPKLAIWCTRIYGKRAGSDYEQYIRTFDLRAAELQGSVKIDGKYFSDDYRLYWPGGRNAWGYRRDVGVMLIDMAIPEVVADNGQLAERHPMLGEGFALIAFKDAADPEQAGLYVRSANGRIYRLREDLSVIETN